MNKVFRVSDGFKVPDGTWVHSILDSQASFKGDLPFTEDISLALGTIPPHTESKIHIHPVITQVTWVIDGKLTVKMRDAKSGDTYVLNLHKEEAAVTAPMTFFQLINEGDADCRVLYIASPAFLFSESAENNISFNDAIVFDQNWEQLAKINWLLPELADPDAFSRKRQELIDKLRGN